MTAAGAAAGRLAPALDAAGAYWSWWTGELAAMLPEGLRRRLTRREPVLLAESDAAAPGGFRLLRRTADGALVPEPRRAAALGLPLWLRLPPEAVLVRRIDWPVMAPADLRRAIALDLDRQTPCAAETLWFDVEPVARDAARRRLHLDLAVAHAATVEALRARLRDAQGVEPARIGLGLPEGGLRFTLRPGVGGAAPAAIALLPRSLRGRLLLLCGLLGVLNLGLHLEAERARRERLDAAVIEARLRAQRVEALRTQITERRQLRDDMMTRRADIGLLSVLEQLTRLMPDDAWLDSVEVRGGSLYVTGYAPVAATLVALIETSPMFADAQFRSPVVPDRARGRERFDMAIRLRGDVRAGSVRRAADGG
jgi:general secretion pathway protein L